MARYWLLGAIAGSSALQHQILLKDEPDKFVWSNITPSKSLEYTSCYGGFHCARLDVPLNWNATGHEREGDRAAIAIIKLPARVPITHESYGGIVLVNPGGPGESGVDQVLARGTAMQTIVDSDTAPENATSDNKYFDIVGFDPRGVKYTTPSLNCFPNAFSQQTWLLDRPGYGEIYESDSSFAIEWARTEALGKSCTAYDGDKSIVRYVNTAQVVEDMLEIVERHGEWREATTDRSIAEETGPAHRHTRARASWKQGQEKLQFWGISYGSLLGQTFAAMHPDRIERLTIDGVLDPDDYYFGRWLANLQDADMVMRKLVEYCAVAGTTKCPLATSSDPEDIEDLIAWLMVSLKQEPLYTLGDDTNRPDPIIVTFDDFYLRAINAMAFPHSAAEDFFDLLNELSRGNVSEVATSKQAQLNDAAALAGCRSLPGGCLQERYFGLLGPTPVIECMDSAAFRQQDITKYEFRDYYEKLQRQSEWFSPSWARHRMSCIGIKQKPGWTHEGDISGNTAHPLLILGNTHDTVTPIKNAHKVSTLFAGSVVLQQDSQGHCSHSMPSKCTAKVVRAYFQTGKLPERGTVCAPDYLPFIGRHRGEDEPQNQPDVALEYALSRLAEPWPLI